MSHTIFPSHDISPHHGIFHHVIKQFPYDNFFIKKSMTWHGIFFKFSFCSHEQVHLLAHSPISAISKSPIALYFENDVLVFLCML
jgi:hypothetical protein